MISSGVDRRVPARPDVGGLHSSFSIFVFASRPFLCYHRLVSVSGQVCLYGFAILHARLSSVVETTLVLELKRGGVKKFWSAESAFKGCESDCVTPLDPLSCLLRSRRCDGTSSEFLSILTESKAAPVVFQVGAESRLVASQRHQIEHSDGFAAASQIGVLALVFISLFSLLTQVIFLAKHYHRSLVLKGGKRRQEAPRLWSSCGGVSLVFSCHPSAGDGFLDSSLVAAVAGTCFGWEAVSNAVWCCVQTGHLWRLQGSSSLGANYSGSDTRSPGIRGNEENLTFECCLIQRCLIAQPDSMPQYSGVKPRDLTLEPTDQAVALPNPGQAFLFLGPCGMVKSIPYSGVSLVFSCHPSAGDGFLDSSLVRPSLYSLGGGSSRHLLGLGDGFKRCVVLCTDWALVAIARL
ncbi:hypothetical protein F2Q68_00010765 [Brassica cretica]|uniref:Uncharacterized protein n=1 Tax=Brassica cretica TaxID=69181 RepID=A0A8S9KQR2_BRACR|nr:hypothetical protein F2Q68_00010765 [Brassica cretica]